MMYTLILFTIPFMVSAYTVNVPDEEIIVSSDILFCSDQIEQNQHLIPSKLVDDGTVWRVGNKRWNVSYEELFSKWISENLEIDLFVELGLATDCADAALALRAIFARIHNLPQSFASNRYGNRSRKYRHLKHVPIWNQENWKESFKEDQRFQKALKDWMKGTGTENLHLDTYQVKVLDNDKPSFSIGAGTIYLDRNHVEIINFKKGSVMPYQVLASTRPVEVRELELYFLEFDFNNSSQVRSGISRKQHNNSRGFVKWNWDVNCKKIFKKVDDMNMPYYSGEQSEIHQSQKMANHYNSILEDYNLNKTYQEKLINEGIYTQDEIDQRVYVEVDSIIQSTMRFLKNRVKLIQKGLTRCEELEVFSVQACIKDSIHEKIKNKTRYTYKLIKKEELEKYQKYELHKLSPTSEYFLESYVNNGTYRKYLTSIDDKDIGKYFEFKNHIISKMYNELSTPSRDKRFEEIYIGNIEEVLEQLSLQNKKKMWRKIKKTMISLSADLRVSLGDIMEYSWLKSQPWMSVEERWGFDRLEENFQKLIQNKGQSIKEYIDILKIEDKSEKKKKLQEFEKYDLDLVRELNFFKRVNFNFPIIFEGLKPVLSEDILPLLKKPFTPLKSNKAEI